MVWVVGMAWVAGTGCQQGEWAEWVERAEWEVWVHMGYEVTWRRPRVPLAGTK